MPMPRSGEVLHLTRAASVQFITNPLLFRVIRVHDWPTYDGWVWIDGYEINAAGDALERRSLFVKVDGLRWVRQEPKRPSVRTLPGLAVAPTQRNPNSVQQRRPG